MSRFDGKTFVNFTLADGLPMMDVHSFASDAEGMLWIADTGNSRLLRFNPYTSQFIGGFDRHAGLMRPIAIACDRSNTLYVTDSAAADVVRYSFVGQKLGSLGDNRRLSLPATQAHLRELHELGDGGRVEIDGLAGRLFTGAQRKGQAECQRR
jgi:sugar lactone lactonase YvrE